MMRTGDCSTRIILPKLIPVTLSEAQGVAAEQATGPPISSSTDRDRGYGLSRAHGTGIAVPFLTWIYTYEITTEWHLSLRMYLPT